MVCRPVATQADELKRAEDGERVLAERFDEGGDVCLGRDCLPVPKFGTLILVSRSAPAVAFLLLATQASPSPRTFPLSHVSTGAEQLAMNSFQGTSHWNWVTPTHPLLVIFTPSLRPLKCPSSSFWRVCGQDETCALECPSTQREARESTISSPRNGTPRSLCRATPPAGST
jgi:hypothetical protein